MNWKSLILAAAIGVLPVPGGDIAASEHSSTYVQNIGRIFRLHLKSIEQLVASEGRYADNVVRHAMALSKAADLLDHVVAEEENRYGGIDDWPWKNLEEYEKFHAANTKAIGKLVDAASAWVGGGEKARLRKAIEDLKQTCRDCHRNRSNFP